MPHFQRGLRWKSSNVVELFDSIYRGYPIGSLLFYKRPAEAERLSVGPLTVDAPETSEAWWVVDGQQRVTSLAACLARPVPLPDKPSKEDPFVLYFDAEDQRFEPPPKNWSLVYPDRIRARWSPLYDQVATVAWEGPDRALALKLAGVKDFGRVDRAAFERLAEKAGVEWRRVLERVDETLEDLRRSWGELAADLPLPPEHREALREHWRKVPLLRDAGPLG